MALKSVRKSQQPAAPAEAGLGSEAQRQKIAEIAYYRAQQRGFSPGYELEDWFAAEAEVKGEGEGKRA